MPPGVRNHARATLGHQDGAQHPRQHAVKLMRSARLPMLTVGRWKDSHLQSEDWKDNGVLSLREQLFPMSLCSYGKMTIRQGTLR
jgi:hypothetical protein